MERPRIMIRLDIKFMAICLICGFLIPVFSIQDWDLFPYDEAAGSTRFSFGDDGQMKVQFKSPFKLFNKTHLSIVISGNGRVSFEPGTAPTSAQSNLTPPKCYDLGPGYRIMPFSADSYEVSGSKLTFMETARHDLLQKAGKDITAAFPEFQRKPLDLSWMFIVTWKDVVRCCTSSDHSKRNTFQLVLVKSESRSFVLFYYARIEWSHDLNWAAGFDFGNSRPRFSLPGSCTNNFSTVITSSNINDVHQGKWVFRVDSDLILPTNTNELFSIQPSVVPIMGNVPIILRVPILELPNVTSTICSFMDPSRPRPSEVTGVVVNVSDDTDTVICPVPFLYSLGKIAIKLVVRYASESPPTIYNGYIYVVREQELEEAIPQINLTMNRDAGALLSATWDPSSITMEGIKRFDTGRGQLSFPDLVQVILLEFKRNSWNELGPVTPPFLNNGHHLSLLNMSVMNQYLEKSGTKPYPRAFALKAKYQLESGMEIHKLLPFPILTSTDLITVDLQLGNGAAKQTNDSDGNIYDSYCKAWYEKEPHPPIQPDTLPCPRTVEQAENDWRFSLDRLDPSRLQILNPGASSSYSQSVPSPSGYGSHCTFNNQGVLIRSIPSAGRLQRQSSNGRMNYWAYYLQDTMPYLYCCMWSSFKETSCASYYYSKRPSNPGGRNYSPSHSSRVTGLAHVASFDRFNYTLTGGDEVWMIQYSSEGNDELPSQNHHHPSVQFNMQARVSPFYAVDSKELLAGASVITQVVMEEVDDEKAVRVQVSTEPQGFIKVMVDGELINGTGENGAVKYNLYHDRVTISFKSEKHLVASFSSGFSVSLMTSGGNDYSLHFVATASSHLVKQSYGLLFNEFSSNWDVQENESLFTYPSGESYSDYNNILNLAQEKEIPESSLKGYVFCDGFLECNYDYSRTNSSSLAETGRNAYEIYLRVLKATTTVLRECELPNDLENGQVNFSSLTVGSALTASCNSNYMLDPNLSSVDGATFICANVNDSTSPIDSVQWINSKSNVKMPKFACILKNAEAEDKSSGGGINIDFEMIIFICCIVTAVVIIAVIVAECTYCRPFRMYFVNRFRPGPRSETENDMELF